MNWSSLLKISVFLLMVSTAFSQDHVIWFKADPSVFNSSEWIELSKEFSLSTPSQALSSSRNPELKKVYEVHGACDLRAFERACSVFGNNVYSIERGPTYTPLFVPNDMNAQPGISDYALNLIGAPQAWDLTQGDDSVVIAISDQNFNVTHQDLEGKYLYYDASNTAPTTHGTAVAITAAGKTNNGYGLSSIGFNSSLALYKMSFNEVLAASYAGADIINISWTSGCYFSQIEQDVIDEVAANGSFIVASAGNGNTCGLPDAYVFPASYRHVFSVTSVGPTDNHEQWIGDPTSTHNHNDSVDLAAPGYDVALSPAPGWFLNMNGSSFAAAYVSGTVALMLSVNKCMSNIEIESILKNSASPLYTLNPSYAGKLGAGRLNAYQAVLGAMNVWNPLNPTFSVSDACDANDASATLVIQGGQSPYTANWSNGYVGFNNSGLSTDTLLVHLVDAHGCRLDTVISVIDIVPPTYSVLLANPTCYGSTNGGVQLNINNDTPTMVTWNNGTQGQQMSGLTEGVYTANLSYGVSCNIQVPVSLVAPAPLLVTANLTDVTAAGNGAIDITPSGGIAPYSFNWNSTDTLEDLINLDAGDYNLILTDANGCQLTDSFQIQNLLGNDGEVIETQSLSIFPNPNQGGFTVETPHGQAYNLEIYDLQGRIVLKDYIQVTKSFNLTLAAGKYQIRAFSLSAPVWFQSTFIVY
jgi:hypothetical protein